MEKKFLGFILAICLILPCVFLISACGKKDYTISFEENGGSIVTDITKRGQSQISPPADPTKNGYSFAGWFLNKTFSGTSYIFGKMPNKNKTLYAKWDLINYDISYELNDGFNHADNPTTYTIESDTVTLENPTKTGFDFTGWTGHNGTTPQKIVSITKGTFGDLTFTANWTITKHNVSFVVSDSNYGSVDTTSLNNINFNTAISAIDNVLTIGTNTITATPTTATTEYTYKFTEWQIKYGNSDYFGLMATDKVTDDVEIKAVFSRETTKYGVCWKNGEEVLQDGDVNYNATSSYIGNTPTKTATEQFTYSFIGWSTDKNATTPAFTTNISSNITSATTYYAVFSKTIRSYGVCWMNGESVLQDGDVNYNATSSYIGNTPTKTATEQFTYSFIGWSTDKNATTPAFTTNTSGNITVATIFYAIFESEALVKENNGTLVLKINGADVASPYTYAGSTYALSATGNKGTAPNTFTVVNGTGEATISDSTLTVTKAGTLTIKVNNAGDGSYHPATETSNEITINKGNPGLSYTETIIEKHVGDTFTNALTNAYNLAVTYSKYSSFEDYGLNTVTGEVTITKISVDFSVKASINENDLWNSQFVSYTVKVVPNIELRIKNNIGFEFNTYEDWKVNTEKETYEGATFTLTANCAIPLNNVVFSIVSGGTGEVTISGSTLSLIKAGTVIIRVVAEAEGYVAPYSHDFTTTFNKGEIASWNEDIQISSVSLYDDVEDAFITTQSTNFTAVAAIYGTTIKIPATYSSSDDSIATVNATTGEVTILGTTGQTVIITATINLTNDNLWEDLTDYTITYTLTIG